MNSLHSIKQMGWKDSMHQILANFCQAMYLKDRSLLGLTHQCQTCFPAFGLTRLIGLLLVTNWVLPIHITNWEGLIPRNLFISTCSRTVRGERLPNCIITDPRRRGMSPNTRRSNSLSCVASSEKLVHSFLPYVQLINVSMGSGGARRRAVYICNLLWQTVKAHCFHWHNTIQASKGQFCWLFDLLER